MERAPLIESIPARWRGPLAIVVAIGAGIGLYLLGRFYRDDPVTYSDPIEHFKYGSTGGERASGFPYAVWQAMPELFSEYLPGKKYLPETPYAPLGFLYEKNGKGSYKDLPVGVQRRNVQGLDRVFLNCAICHTGSVRASAESSPHLVAGMPSNTVNLQEFQRFLFASATDERFTPGRILNEIERMGALKNLGYLNERLLSKFGISLMRERILLLRDRFKYMDQEPDFGPGRVDTFSPGKVLMNFPMDLLPERERVGTCDFPSVWMQGAKDHMHLHWDGNNTSTEERNRNAAFGTGANPGTLDRPSLARTVEFLKTAEPPKFEDFFKTDLAALPPAEAEKFKIRPDRAERGKQVYLHSCAKCHGTNGRDFGGSEYVGKVEPIQYIKTDRWRLDSFTSELVAPMSQLYAGYGKERFSHFSKTYGYANLPLDGVWLRAPYLHNGSVPTLRDLLEPAVNRPKVFYRGYDVYDPVRGGFVSDRTVEPESSATVNPQRVGRRYFRYDTQAVPGYQTAAFAKVLEIDAKTRLVTLDRPLIRTFKATKITAADGKVLLSDIPVEKSGVNDTTLILKELPEELQKGGGLDYSTPRERNEGNSNAGHEYGANLTGEEKDSVVEFLKTF